MWRNTGTHFHMGYHHRVWSQALSISNIPQQASSLKRWYICDMLQQTTNPTHSTYNKQPEECEEEDKVRLPKEVSSFSWPEGIVRPGWLPLPILPFRPSFPSYAKSPSYHMHMIRGFYVSETLADHKKDRDTDCVVSLSRLRKRRYICDIFWVCETYKIIEALSQIHFIGQIG